MPYNIAIQMDDLSHINIDSDTTIVLALEAQRRGYQLFYYQPQDMFLSDGKVMANVSTLFLDEEKQPFFLLENPQTIELSQTDVVLMRQDPPFDMNYLTYTYMLELIHPETFVVNHPAHVRNCPEKLFINRFPDLMPPTLISLAISEMKSFRSLHESIVLKPLYAHGGIDIHHIEDDDLLEQVATELIKKYHQPIIAQRYIPAVVKGDKRVILIDGEVAGAINRVPKQGEIRSNLVQGGVAEKTSLTTREQEICRTIGPHLCKRDLILVGIDIIDGYLTEINVTSPTGIKSINQLDNTNIEEIFWNSVEIRLSN